MERVANKKKGTVTFYSNGFETNENSAADQSRVIEVLRTALELAVEFFNGIIRLDEANVTLEVFKEIVTNEAYDPYNDVAKVRAALAEAQRILEGKC